MSNSHANSFAWTDDDCRAMGIDRQEAHLAWLIVSGTEKNKAMVMAGYSITTNSIEYIVVRPSYARAVQVMATQYLNAVALPEAIKANVGIAKDRTAAAAARVQAATRLIDQAASSLQTLKDERLASKGELNLDRLDVMIRELEAERARNAKPAMAIKNAALDDSQLLDLV